MKAALVLKEVELSTIRRSLTESSQEVKNLKTSIANLKSQIANYETGTGGGAVPSLGTVPQLGQDYVRLMREFKIQETLVELLTKQYEMARLSEAKDVAPIQVLQKAKVPERKSKPSRSKIVMSSVFIALLASLVLSIILEKISNMPAKEKDRWKSLVKIT
jgi:tyrosine-protein kinase Etk/Wzc